jgi:hypothetical protein
MTVVLLVVALVAIVQGGRQRQVTAARQDARIERLIRTSNILAEQQLALIVQVQTIAEQVLSNGEVVKALASENKALLQRLTALSEQLTRELAEARTHTDSTLDRLVQMQRDTQLAALRAVQEAQLAQRRQDPTSEPLIDPKLLETLIDQLTQPVKPGKGPK